MEKRTKEQTTIYKHTYKTKDRVTRTSPKPECSGMVASSCSTRDTRRVYLVTNPMISHQCEKDREVTTINGTYP